MTNTQSTRFLEELPLAGSVVGEHFDGWSAEVREDFQRNAHNGEVGTKLLSETDRVRVWEIRVDPGERVHAHRHVLDYFWTAVTAGSSRQHTFDGTTREVHYTAGETRHYHFAAGEYLLHDLENIGAEPLVFTTVEFKQGENTPIEL